jgi:hypothetical protein
MNKEEIESLFKKYKVRIPKEKQGQSECYECKRHHKYSLTWTSFLYEYKENYYCFEHIVNILLQQEKRKAKVENICYFLVAMFFLVMLVVAIYTLLNANL